MYLSQRDTYADGEPKPSGRLRFAVLGDLSYGECPVEDVHQSGRRPKVWRYGVGLRVAGSTQLGESRLSVQEKLLL